jgi:arylsulfatase A-like enzyme
MTKKLSDLKLLLILLSAFLLGCQNKDTEQSSLLPNIVIIYMDDLGYGDMSAYGASEIQTPNMDRLANEGIRFTNAYATSATCTPSRYALLTGIYPWRNENARILPGTAHY